MHKIKIIDPFTGYNLTKHVVFVVGEASEKLLYYSELTIEAKKVFDNFRRKNGDNVFQVIVNEYSELRFFDKVKAVHDAITSGSYVDLLQ